jgi:hypothetical protein
MLQILIKLIVKNSNGGATSIVNALSQQLITPRLKGADVFLQNL